MSNKVFIIDRGADKYLLDTPYGTILGRRWDHNAEELEVVIPTAESSSTCYMIIETTKHKVIDHKEVKASEGYKIKITEDMSQYCDILIGFNFVRTDLSKKESEFKVFHFGDALNPNATVPLTSEQGAALDVLRLNAFVDANLKDGTTSTIQFKNVNGTVKKEVTVLGGSGSGTVTSVGTGTGLTGGPITTSGTISLDSSTQASLALADTAVQPSGLGDGTITINQGGVQKGTFTVNQSSNTTINIDKEIPTYPTFDVSKSYMLVLKPNSTSTAYELVWQEISTGTSQFITSDDKIFLTNEGYNFLVREVI